MNTWAWISLGATVILAGFTLLLARETVVLARGMPPITSITRSIILRWPGRALVVTHTLTYLVGLFTAHFVWDAGLL
jgi:hypothetical protein